MSRGQAYNVADLRALARRRLPRGIYDYVERGCEDEYGLAGNRAAFARINLLPKVLRDVSNVDLGTSLFGRPMPMPIAFAPTGSAGLVAHNGDLKLAKAAARLGIPFTISTASTMNVEEIATAGARLWFQLYLWEDKALSMAVVDKARELGCELLMLTVDIPVPPNREFNMRNDFGIPFRPTRRNLSDMLAHPRWLTSVMLRYALTTGMPRQANLPAHLRAKVTRMAPPGASFGNSDLTWDEVARIRDRWGGTFLLKGIVRPDDAERAAALGFDGIVVSNHGGRNLDSAIPTIDALPAIAAAVGDRLTLLLDSGIQRGSDVVKALARGAKGVLAGRAPLYGLAIEGEEGAVRAMTFLKQELATTMALCGAARIDEIASDLLAGHGT
jgi:isopentenyl diphosphate isomerase/L-lactate dehydrogenase-like FMN-dependent dehydrogenase